MKSFIQKLRTPKTTHGTQSGKKKWWRSKVLWISAVVIVALVVGGFFVFNNAQKDNLYARALANVSEARHFMRSASTDSLEVQFFSGTREEPFSQNGVTGKPVPFAIINVDSRDGTLKGLNQIEGTVRIGEEQLPIMLTRNPYDPQNFATDIGKLVEANRAVEVTLFITSTNHPTFKLELAFDADAITWKQALRIATEKTGSKLNAARSFEVYVKIINNVAKDSGAFWYVQFITDDGKTYFCVIAPDGSTIC